MDTQTEPHSETEKNYVVLPPEIVEPAPFFSAKFMLFTVVVMTVAVALGLHGGISFIHFGKSGAPTAQAPGAMAAIAALVSKPAPAAPPVPPLNTAALAVTSISMGEPSFAIINGVSRTVGDSVDAPGAPGWKIKAITEGTVLLQNGTSVATLQLSDPGLKPLNDDLHPLN
jgi:hypothetical protein